MRDRLHLPAPQEQALLDAIDSVFLQHERLWQQSKQEAIQAVSAGFTERMNRMRDELSARDATVSSIAKYFEELVADLTDRVHRDPKTRLMNFRRFIEQLEAFLALEQRGRWCAVGLVDITSFKWYNDTLGHALGDRIIDRVARLLREQIRSDDLIAQESPDVRDRPGAARPLRRRRVLLPDPGPRSLRRRRGHRRALPRSGRALRLDHRGRRGSPRSRSTSTSASSACCSVRSAERRPLAKPLAHDLLARADKLMYEAKGERARQHRLASRAHREGRARRDRPPRQPAATEAARCLQLADARSSCYTRVFTRMVGVAQG